MPALTGVTVLEFSRVLAGPWCGMLLADLGAEVIKVESFDGDDTRGLGPPFLHGLSAYFACCNRGKRSLAIDLRAEGAAELVSALVRKADVLIENYRTGVAESLGLGYPQLREINPRLVYCSISGYGRTGPTAAKPGYDFVVQAESGLMSITGAEDGEAYKVGVAVADLATGQNAAIAILAALRQRDITGHGQHVNVSLIDSQMTWLANIASNVLFTGEDAPRFGNSHASIVPYQAFAASDREFVLAVASEGLWQRTCSALGRDDWGRDPAYASNALRVENRERLCAAMSEHFSTRPAAHWLALLGAAGVPAGPINSVKQALDDPTLRERGMRVEVDGIPMLSSALRLSESPVAYVRAPPRLGEHSDELVREAGLDPGLLRAAGVVQ